jgi:hypothetical protein
VIETGAATTVVCKDVAVFEAEELLAVTETRSVEPTWADVKTNVLLIVPCIGMQFAPFMSQVLH